MLCTDSRSSGPGLHTTHFTLTVPLSTHKRKWVLANLILLSVSHAHIVHVTSFDLLLGWLIVDLFCVTEQVMEYHLQAIDELSISNDSDAEEGDHVDAIQPVTSKYCQIHVFHFPQH